MMLSHIRVLELADGLTDLGGRMLAELGAEVIVFGGDRAAFNHGKVRVAGDAEDAQRLADTADIVLEDCRSHPSRIHAPNAVHVVAVAAFDRSRPATDLTLMAESGLMHVVGEPDKPPLRLPGEQAYALTGIQVATAALLGLRSGPQRIEVSALQSATLANYREAVMYDWTGRIGRRPGNRLVRGKSGVRQVWPCADGYVTWSMIDNPNMMRALVRVMGDAAGELAQIDWNAILVADTDQAVIDRWQGVVGAFFAQHTKQELGDWSLEHGWGLSPIFTPEEVRESAHLADRGLFVDVETDVAPMRLPGPLFHHGAGAGAPPRRLMPVVPASATDWSPR